MKKNRSSHQRYSIKKGVFKNFTKFTGKHLCQSLFLNKVAGLRPASRKTCFSPTALHLFASKVCYWRRSYMCMREIEISNHWKPSIDGLHLTYLFWFLLVTVRFFEGKMGAVYDKKLRKSISETNCWTLKEKNRLLCYFLFSKKYSFTVIKLYLYPL